MSGFTTSTAWRRAPQPGTDITKLSFVELVWLLAYFHLLPATDDLTDRELRALDRAKRMAFTFLALAKPDCRYEPELQAALDQLERAYPCVPENYNLWFDMKSDDHSGMRAGRA